MAGAGLAYCEWIAAKRVSMLGAGSVEQIGFGLAFPWGRSHVGPEAGVPPARPGEGRPPAGFGMRAGMPALPGMGVLYQEGALI